MDPVLREVMRKHTPQINPSIANGLAVEHIPQCEAYIDEVMRAAAKDFPEQLKYLGFKQCTPKEEFTEITRLRGNARRVFETAKSNLYLVKYLFSWKGVDLPPRYVFLPYVGLAGSIHLSGPKYYVSPVLTDKVISISQNSVFVRLLRDKLVFERVPHNIIVDDRREYTQVVNSMIYHRSTSIRKLKSTVTMSTTLVHYLLCKFGTMGMFQKVCGFMPHVGTSAEINNESYPVSDWVICKTTGIKPKGYGRRLYESGDVCLAIPKHLWNSTVQSLVAGFYYVVDHFPTRVKAQWLKGDYKEEKRLWIVLLGHIVFTGDINEAKLFEDITIHIRSLDDYMDSIVATKLRELKYECKDIYDLMAVIISNFNEWMVLPTDKTNSMYDKELTILPDVLFSITSGIFKFLFKIRSAAERKDLSEKDVMIIMTSQIRMGAIFSITKSTGSNNLVSTESYSGDNKFFKLTSMLVPQAKTAKPSSKRSRVNLKDPSKHLNASIAEVGSFSYLPKSDPTGRSRINPHLRLSPQAEVLRNPKFIIS